MTHKTWFLIYFVNPFPQIGTLLTPLQQTTFEKSVAKGEIAHDNKFVHLPQCFQLYLMIKPLFMDIFHTFANMFSKSSAADLFYVGKGL